VGEKAKLIFKGKINYHQQVAKPFCATFLSAFPNPELPWAITCTNLIAELELLHPFSMQRQQMGLIKQDRHDFYLKR
jgi:hypothetical protein